MTVLAPPLPMTIVPESPHREGRAEFLRWAREQWEAIQAALTSNGQAPPAGEPADEEVLEQLRTWGNRVQARPSGQPMAVADIAAQLFGAYRIDGGHVQLAGCQLTDVPFLRLSFAAGDDEVRHVFVSAEGDSVPAELVECLGLTRIEPAPRVAQRLDDATLATLIAAGRRIATTTVAERDIAAKLAEPLVVAVVWAKQASGKLQFTIGEAAVDLPFADWASLLTAPAYVGAHSGQSGFHMAGTDDGRIDLANHIAYCERSNRRVLADELATCCVTGKRVLLEFTQSCPVLAKPALIDEFAACGTCRQRVSKRALHDGECEACRSLTKITRDDPRLIWILEEHPGLARWTRWQLAETEQVYIARAKGLVRRLLVVVDKGTLAVRHLATSSLVSPHWQTVSSAEKPNFLS